MTKRVFVAIFTAALLIIALALIGLFIKPMAFAGFIKFATYQFTGTRVRFDSLELGIAPLVMKASNITIDDTVSTVSDEKPTLRVGEFWLEAKVADCLFSDKSCWNLRLGDIEARMPDDDSKNNQSGQNKQKEQNDTNTLQRANATLKRLELDDSDLPLWFRFEKISVQKLLLIPPEEGSAQRIELASLALEKKPQRTLELALNGQYGSHPLNVEGTVTLPTGSRSKQIELQARMLGSDLNVSGQLGHNGLVPGELKITLSAEELTELSSLTEWPLQEYVPLRIEARIQAPTPNEWKIRAEVEAHNIPTTLEVAVLEPGDAQPLHVSATINKRKASDKHLWSALLPATISGDVEILAHEVSVDPLAARFPNSKVSGRLRVDHTAQPMEVDLALQADTLDINDFRSSSSEQPDDNASSTATDKPTGKVITNRRLDFAWLNAATVNADVQVDNLYLNKSRFRNVQVTTVLADGKLNLDPVQADMNKGGVRGKVAVEQQADTSATIHAKLYAREITPADLGMPDNGMIDGGETDLGFDLTTQGATMQQLASNLNGEFALEIQRATLRNSLFEIIGSDLVTQTVNLINPFTSTDDSTELECAAVRFQATDGNLHSPDQIILETQKMKIRGGGDINLNDETVRIDLIPKARSGVGVGLSDLVKFVRIGGTLGNIEPVPDPKGILKSSATIGAAIATAGLSLLAQGLFNKVSSAGTACGKVFENNIDVPPEIAGPDEPG